MYAVIETGGKQYRVAPGDKVRVETLPGDVGSAVEFGRVLAVVNDANEVTAGVALASARVTGTISEHGRGEKVIVFISSNARSNTSAPSAIGKTTRR